MKKRIFGLLLCLCLATALLPTAALAADSQVKVSSMDLTIETPQAGMTKQEGAQLALLSAQTSYGDLAASGAVTLLKLTWSGEFDQTDRSNPKFKAGLTYTATIQIHFVYEKGYTANHKIVDNGYYMDSSLFKVTVNGTAAEAQQGTPGNPLVKVNITVPAPELSDEEQAAAEAERLAKFELRHASLRASATPYTTAQADALWVGKQGYDVVILDESAKPTYGYTYSDVFDKNYTEQERSYITKLIVDFEPALFANEEQKENFAQWMIYLPNLKEIWLSDKVDVAQFVEDLKSGTEGNGVQKWYWSNSTSFGTADATLCIPSSSAATVTAQLGNIAPCFSIKVYDGDVYTAQKAGVAAARDYCTNHSYTAVIMSADRVAHYADCSQPTLWYYSCAICGKCEYNDNHTVNRDFMGGTTSKYSHQYEAQLATEEAYIGVNAAGDQVYWKSCIYCGHSYNYHQEHLTQEDWTLSGVDLTYEQYQKAMASAVAQRETAALNSTTTQTDMFTLSAKSTAKMSTWAQSDVNFALDNNLLDTALLGSDYTKSITRLQFCSVAVRLAEELTGKEIAPAPSGTFSDTDNLYVRKAYAAGITTGVTATTFDHNGTLTRQQMAAFIYRTLQYVEKNSDYRYTDYVSKLSTYSDSGQIQSWATESMAFMNALDLIKGTTATTLAPNGICTIEQAVAVAYRSIYAHQIGWYQAVSGGNYLYSPLGSITPMTLSSGDRVWVTGNRIGSGVRDTFLDNLNGEYSSSACCFPVVEPYTGETCYISAAKLKPIRD